MLLDGSQHAVHPQFKDRCHCIYLSSRGYDMAALTDIFNVSRPTITNWFDRWESLGVLGLYNVKGQGRKPILDVADSGVIKSAVKANPQELKVARESIKTELNKDFSDRTLRRFLKSLVGRSGGVGVKV